MKRSLTSPPLWAALGVLSLSGCAKAPPPPPDASEAHLHHNHAPHGGTVVSVGEEEYQVELVLDPEDGRLQAYVLDAEMESFVRSPSPSIEILAALPGEHRTITLAPVANPTTGETVGDTALYEGSADWLKRNRQFEAVLKTLTIKGAVYSDVKFNFPKGNEGSR